MKFTQIPASTFKELQLNAGILTSNFAPTTGTVESNAMLGATSGGISFTATPTYTDLGDDIDNCPKNMMELKKLESWEIKMSGTFLTVNTAQAKSLMAAADIGSSDTTKVTPRNDVALTDFNDIWWIGDYSDKNGATNGGYIAIHMMNALSTGGFQLQSSDKAKGQFAFEYSAHYSMDAADTVPFEIYIRAGTEEA